MNDKYVMQLIVPVRLVGPIMELLNGEGVMVKTEPYQEDQKRHRYVNGHRDKGVRADQLVIDLIGAGVVKLTQIRNAFVKRGFAATTAQPTLSTLVKKGKIKRSKNGAYQLI